MVEGFPEVRRFNGGVVGWAEIRAGGPGKLLHMSRVALTDDLHIGVEWAKSHWPAELSFGRPAHLGT